MFEKVTSHLVQQTDRDGTLIAVSRLNDSEKLKPLAVVIKCPGAWFWQKTKYKPTDFTLNDLLLGEKIQPVIVKKVFLNKYESKHNGSVSGSAEVNMVGGGVTAQGCGSSKTLSSLGILHKESMDMQHFLKESKCRKLDLEHSLIRQIQSKNQIFTLLKERIFTTSDCTLNFSVLKEGGCSAVLNALSPVKVKKSFCGRNSKAVAIEIPPHTVLAYSVSELTIQSDGCYEIGVSPDGTEGEDSDYSEADGLCRWTQITAGDSLNALNTELASVKVTLCELACLPPQFSVLKNFQKILDDQTLLSILEDDLDKTDDQSIHDSHTLPDTSIELTDKFLNMQCCGIDEPDTAVDILPENYHQSGAKINHNGSSEISTNQNRKILTAMSMLIDAAEEIPTDGLDFLKSCTPDKIKMLNELVNQLTSPSQPVFINQFPFFLRDDELLEEVELLFNSCNISLKRNYKEVYAEIGSGNKVLPLVMCIVIHGLAYLNESKK